MAYISNKVRYYHSEMADAPVLSGTAGALIAVLDACLVNGFGTKAINNLTVTDGIATAQISSGHTFGEGDVLRIAGVTGALSGLNDDWRLASVTADTVTWSVEGLSIPAGSATGTITCLRAPAGWEKVFSATNRAAYRSLRHAEHNGLFLYVDDTGTTTARVRGYEAMTDIDTGTGPFPTDAQMSGGGWWGKSTAASATAREWILAADARRLLFCPRVAGQSAKSFAFGLLLDAASVDTWATFLSTASSASIAVATHGGGANWGDLAFNDVTTNIAGYLARSRAGAPSITAYVTGYFAQSAETGMSTYYAAGTLPADMPPLAPVMVLEVGLVGRGFFPGPCPSTVAFSTAQSPPGELVGVPGNGACLQYAGPYSQSRAWFIHLGTDGRWD